MLHQFLLEVHQEPDGTVYSNAQRYTEHQYGRWFNTYAHPAHQAGSYQQRHNIYHNRYEQYAPGAEYRYHATKDNEEGIDQAVAQAVHNELAALKESDHGAGEGNIILAGIEYLVHLRPYLIQQYRQPARSYVGHVHAYAGFLLGAVNVRAQQFIKDAVVFSAPLI